MLRAKSLQSCPTLCNPLDCSPPGSSVHGIFPGKSTGVACHFLHQGIFPTQDQTHVSYVSCISRQILYHLSHQRSPCCCITSVMSDSVRPHRRQPNRLSRPWDSPGKNAGVGCHFLLQCMKVKSESEVAQSCPTLCNPLDCSPPGSSVHGIFPGKNTGVGCHALLQGIFPTQGSNPRLLYLLQRQAGSLPLAPTSMHVSPPS